MAALLEAAIKVFAEKGYDAVTMTEIAARAGAPIGSLYQFFPNKETLADVLLVRISERMDEAFREIEERSPALTVPELVDALLGVLEQLQDERAAAATLIESLQETSTRAAELRLSRRRRLSRILLGLIEGLSQARAETMSLVVIQLMKIAAAQSAEPDPTVRQGMLRELRYLMCLYLNEKPLRTRSVDTPEGSLESPGCDEITDTSKR